MYKLYGADRGFQKSGNEINAAVLAPLEHLSQKSILLCRCSHNHSSQIRRYFRKFVAKHCTQIENIKEKFNFRQ